MTSRLKCDPLDRCMAALDYLMDDRVGIIKRIDQVPREPGAPGFYFAYAMAANTEAFGLFPNFRNTGGASTQFEIAVAKAAGEAVERYSSAFYEYKNLIKCSYADADFECVDPELFALYLDSQLRISGFTFTKLTKDYPIRWTPAMRLLDRNIVHVPAAMTYMPYYFVEGDTEKPYCQPISTGLACHIGRWRATRSGICETVERDAFTITWQAKMARPHILLESLSDRNYEIVELFDSINAELTILDLTMDNGIPCVLSVLRADDPALPSVAVAAAADPDPEQAIRSSLEELAHTKRYCQLILKFAPMHDPGSQYEKIVSQVSHLGYWAVQERSNKIEFLLESDERIEFENLKNISTGSVKKDCYELSTRIKETGHDVYVKELTTPDVSQFGFNVVRTIVPGYHPLQMGHSHRCLGGTRLWSVPQKLGYEGIEKESGDNYLPHPYP